jgi:hypothetical protein
MPAAALQGCKDAFLDALLSSARMDMFMPGVELVKSGDHVAELLIIVRGAVKVRPGGVGGLLLDCAEERCVCGCSHAGPVEAGQC